MDVNIVTELMDQILNATWIQNILIIVLGVIMALVRILLLPISFIVNMFFPDIEAMLSSIPFIFDTAGTYLAWSFSAFAIPPIVITALILYYGYILVVPFALWTLKLGYKWITTLKGLF